MADKAKAQRVQRSVGDEGRKTEDIHRVPQTEIRKFLQSVALRRPVGGKGNGLPRQEKRGPRKGGRPLWGEEKPRHRWNFPLAENGTLWLVLRRARNDKHYRRCGNGRQVASPTDGVRGKGLRIATGACALAMTSIIEGAGNFEFCILNFAF